MKQLFVLLLFVIFNVNFSFANKLNTIDLSKNKWEYRWGDSPFEKSIPTWTRENSNSDKWQEIKFPSNPPNRNKQTNVWYRVKLPDTLTKDPTLYIFSIDLIAQVYYRNKQIYHFGDFDAQGKGEFKGWPWHMISLPNSSAGEYLYFRVYSYYIDIGLWGEVLISSKGQLFQKLLNDDIPKIMIGSIAIFVGILFILSFLSRWRRIELLILGLLFLAQGIDVLVSAKIIELYLYFPLVKQYMLATSFFFFPVGMALFMDKTLKKKVPFNLIRRLWQIHLVYLICAIVGSLLGFYDIASTYEYFDILYNFISLPILTLFMIYFFFKGDKDTKIITFSFFIISSYWFYTYLIAYGIVPWAEYPSEIAIFSCLLLLSYSIINKLNYTDDLQEQKDELQIISSTDYLTKLKNRKEIDMVLETNKNIFKRYQEPFSIILLDVDNFKEVNDVHGHLTGDEVLISISEILKKFTREIDIVGRWGGEEFLIICPRTNEKEASYISEKLRHKIEKNEFDITGQQTVSVGVSSYKENDSITKLLIRADEAMYFSKTTGKNRITIR
jgi:diguanylate cyclase (GGDEF)-like protein